MSYTAYKGSFKIPLDGNPPIESFRWTRTGGPSIVKVFKGQFDDLLTLGESLTDDFDQIGIDRTGNDFAVLTASQNGDETSEIHERIPGQQSISLLTSPVLIGQFYALGATLEDSVKDALVIIKEETSKVKDTTSKDAAIVAGVAAAVSLAGCADTAGALTALVRKIINRLRLGNEFYLVPCYHYKHTYQYPDRSWMTGYPAGLDEGVGKIFTEAQMRTAESIPVTFPLPYQISAPASPAFWLKEGPGATLTIGQRRQVSVTYIFADVWSDLTYQAY
jgi:hypothetical protein